MKLKKLEMKLKINKITICRRDDLQMQFAQAGLCNHRQKTNPWTIYHTFVNGCGLNY